MKIILLSFFVLAGCAASSSTNKSYTKIGVPANHYENHGSANGVSTYSSDDVLIKQCVEIIKKAEANMAEMHKGEGFCKSAQTKHKFTTTVIYSGCPTLTIVDLRRRLESTWRNSCSGPGRRIKTIEGY